MIQRNKKDELSDKEYLTHLLFETDQSFSAIAQSMELSLNELNSTLKKLGLYWVKDHRRKMSKGQTLLTSVAKKLLPGQKIINEHHLGDRLKLDVYCPSYKLALEFHGIQHFKYSSLFFDSKEEFIDAQKRDAKKAEMCAQQGIALVVFRYNDNISEDNVYDRILDAIKHSLDDKTLIKKVKKPTIKQNQMYQKAKKIRSERNKKYYKKMKEQRKNGRRNQD
jgi:very-short-patch-repair endonuclease